MSDTMPKTGNWNFFEPVIVPAPKSALWCLDTCVRMGEGTHISLACPDSSAREWLLRHFESAFGFRCALMVAATAGAHPEGGYRLAADPAAGIAIEASSLAGVRHAFHTLRQIAFPARGGLTTSGFIMPAFAIEDAPSLGFRGMHFCWFPEHRVQTIERQIRLAAYYKFNYVVLENWGVWRSESCPWFGWPDGKMTSAEIRSLRAIADDLGITLVPQFNVFGHASLSRVRTGNHATLDFAPEYEPLFEPYSGWNWCLSNETARNTIKTLCLELHDLFGRPPFFHIGCDEACPPTCPDCRAADYNALFSSLVRELADLFESRGASIMMWHDMLLVKGDSRWNGFYANGDAEADALLDSLPRSAVICDWYYGAARDDGHYPTLDHFSGKGFRVLTCPADELGGIAAQGAYAATHGLFGILDTTWTGFNGRTIPAVAPVAANAAWGGKPRPNAVLDQDITSPVNWHWRQIGWDMKVSDVRDTGFFNEQYPSTTVTR